jgi:hypothetical protein
MNELTGIELVKRLGSDLLERTAATADAQELDGFIPEVGN